MRAFSIPCLPHLKPHLRPTLCSIPWQMLNSECFLTAASASLLSIYPWHYLTPTGSTFHFHQDLQSPYSTIPLLLFWLRWPFFAARLHDNFRWNHRLLICRGLDHMVYSVPLNKFTNSWTSQKFNYHLYENNFYIYILSSISNQTQIWWPRYLHTYSLLDPQTYHGPKQA